ncbi:MAG: hypothetical protein ACJAT1_002465 [Marivirga sp.]|jgi:hypothetical protein
MPVSKVYRHVSKNPSRKDIVIGSPFLIIGINFGIAFLFGGIIGKWASVPIILIEWCLFLFFIFRYTDKEIRKSWLKKAKGSFGWNILALFIGILPLPLFLLHYEELAIWQVSLPWILLATINLWLEEFYWRGLSLWITLKIGQTGPQYSLQVYYLHLIMLFSASIQNLIMA